MAEFKLGRIRFVWKNNWVTGTTYYKDDIVHYGGRTYLCVAGHAAAADFYTDLENIPTKWNQFTDGQVWRGDWTGPGTLYRENDIVKYGGYVYIANNGHTSRSTLELDQASWDLFAESFDWKYNWVAATIYKINDIVKYGGYTYICNTAHTAAATNALGLEADIGKWDIFSKGFDWKGVWLSAVRYKIGDVVKYGGTTYVCNLGHTSAATVTLGLENDQGKWDYYNAGFEYKGQWIGPTTVTGSIAGTTLTSSAGSPAVGQLLTGGSIAANTYITAGSGTTWTLSVNNGTLTSATYTATIRYKINDLVKQGAGVWICKTSNTSTSSWTTDQTYWTQYVEGIEFENDWTSSGIYQNGDIVRYGGNSYIAKTSNNASAGSPPSSNTTDWDLFATGFRLAGDWNSGTLFKVGEIVRNGGFTYVSTLDSTNQQPPNAGYWEKLNEGIKWRNTWLTATSYVKGDTIKYGPITYICILAHTSAYNAGPPVTGNRPDIDVSGTYWNQLTAGNENDVLTTTGDLVYYSGSGVTRLPVGAEGQVLTVASGQPSWDYFGRTKKVYYVAEHGVDSPAPIYGLTIDQPWASVRYATEQILYGTEYPQAGFLLRMNREFIQREAAEWVKYQIANPTGIWIGFTNDSAAKCERDMGLIADAIIYDLTHTGNAKTSAAANSYFTALGALVTGILNEYRQNAAAISYLSTLVTSVLANTAPASNYQTLNGVSAGNRIKQIINLSYTAETGANTICTTLIGYISTALSNQSQSGLPVLDTAGYTLNVKTGQYYEVLPIKVPPKTAIVGDELRGSRMSPRGKVIATNDKAKSVAALQRLQAITANIISNTSVTPTTGNSATQATTLQKIGSVGSSTAVTRVQANVTEMIDIVTNNTPDAYVYPDPTSYGAGYSDARRLVLANKAFIQAEITAYTVFTYGTAISSIDGSGELINTGTAHGLAAGNVVGFNSTQGGVTRGLTYYVLAAGLTTTAFKVATTSTSSTPVDLTTVASPSPAMKVLKYDAAKCLRDVGYEVDALIYDLTYGETSGCNLMTEIIARSYYSQGVFVEPAAEKTYALAAQTRFIAIVSSIVTKTAVSATAGNTVTQDVSGTAGSAGAATFAQARVQEVYNTINTGTSPTTIAPSTAWVAAALVTARTTLNAAKAEIQSDAVQYVKVTFPTLNFNETLCSRDVGYIVDALGYDLMFGSNYLSIFNGLSYRRGLTSTNIVITTQLAAQQAILNFISKEVTYYVASGATVGADNLWTEIINYVNTGTRPIVSGTNTPTTDLDILVGAQNLVSNKDFFAAEATAYINFTYKSTVTASTGGATDTYTCGSQTWMVAGDAVRFTGTVFGGISTGVTYYILATGLTSTSFQVSLALGGAAVDLSTATGSMTVTYYYSQSRCQNDVRCYIDAIAYDLKYTGNYRSVMAARYYRNALTGSKLEDFFYVSDGCGVRNCTLTGLDGSSDGNTAGAGTYPTGMIPANEFGTQRPAAGAYVSLDPGYGPNDVTAWVTTRSTYIQNVTTFGTGATGQKIDGSIHAGGNDSIVSNDFTQVISAGIGAWVTNLGRAELVSVFTYYSHVGYLAENGGKIRATNGNNSYGDFGSVAEGVDIKETPVYGYINNRNTEADVRNTLTDGVNNILVYEYGNAGTAYTSATLSIAGAGVSAAAVLSEFRDAAVYQVRLTDPGDSTGKGGAGYITQTNLAQTGNTTSITLAVADTASSAAYVGMLLTVISGTGAGQYGYIQAYNSANKVATIYKDTDGTAGWEHVTPGVAIVSALDTTSQYQITPRLTISAPPYSATARTLPSSVAWRDVAFGSGAGTYTNLTATGSVGGSLASFDVTRVQGVYTVAINIPGILYAVGETLTIAGTALGGVTPGNDLTITILGVNTGSSGINRVSVSGTAVTAKFVAIADGSASAATSLDGTTWTALTMPSSLTYRSIAYGTFSGIGRYMAIASGTLTAYYSTNGLNWTSTSMSASTTWQALAYGNSRFIAIATGSNVTGISTAGTSWISGGTLPASTTWTGIAYGKGVWVAVASGGTQAASSTDGGSTWASATLPSSGTWTDVAYGNNMFIAVRSGSTAYAYSTNGTTWTAGTLPGSVTNPSVIYGQGVWLITSDNGVTAYSSDTGLIWTTRTLSTGANPRHGVFGNPGNVGSFVTVASGTSTVAAQIKAGATTRARAYVASNQLTEIWIREPGSGYTGSAPTMTITDPNNTGADATYVTRVGNGAIAQPMWTNRGTGYSAATGTIIGDGYADNYQVGTYVGFRNLTGIPKAGSNVQIAGIDDVWYRLVTVTGLLPNSDGTYNATLQVSPPLGVAEAPDHNTFCTIRLRYSQVRLTGHDFLDIGTGNITNTNYPGLPYSDPIPANETVQSNGGRVFYTSTDQDGNFRVGGLFNVEQATGIATLNADAFNIAGLNELSLGSVALGGSGATISEFSTDPFFTQDSDSVIPTQRAIKAYITSQIGGGQSSLNVNTLTAGIIYVAGNLITTTTLAQININTKVNFKGGIVGDALVLNYFLLNS